VSLGEFRCMDVLMYGCMDVVDMTPYTDRHIWRYTEVPMFVRMYVCTSMYMYVHDGVYGCVDSYQAGLQ
jgi:hypothetical protein